MNYQMTLPPLEAADDTEHTLAIMQGDALVTEITLNAEDARRLACQIAAGRQRMIGQLYKRSELLGHLARYAGLEEDLDAGDLDLVQFGIESRMDGHGAMIRAVEMAARWLADRAQLYPAELDGVGVRALRWAAAVWPAQMRGELIHGSGPAADHAVLTAAEAGAQVVFDTLGPEVELANGDVLRIDGVALNQRFTLHVTCDEDGLHVRAADPDGPEAGQDTAVGAGLSMTDEVLAYLERARAAAEERGDDAARRSLYIAWCGISGILARYAGDAARVSENER